MRTSLHWLGGASVGSAICLVAWLIFFPAELHSPGPIASEAQPKPSSLHVDDQERMLPPTAEAVRKHEVDTVGHLLSRLEELTGKGEFSQAQSVANDLLSLDMVLGLSAMEEMAAVSGNREPVDRGARANLDTVRMQLVFVTGIVLRTYEAKKDIKGARVFLASWAQALPDDVVSYYSAGLDVLEGDRQTAEQKLVPLQRAPFWRPLLEGHPLHTGTFLPPKALPGSGEQRAVF